MELFKKMVLLPGKVLLDLVAMLLSFSDASYWLLHIAVIVQGSDTTMLSHIQPLVKKNWSIKTQCIVGTKCLLLRCPIQPVNHQRLSTMMQPENIINDHLTN
jgi:hypothetical protein